MNNFKKINPAIFYNLLGYLVAVASVALATWLKFLAQPDIIPADVPILYFLAIVPTAIFFGLGPSLLVCVLSFLAYDYYFTPPIHQINLSTNQGPIMAIFLLVGVLVSYLASSLRTKNKIAATEITAREQSEAELKIYRDHLEELVQQRTRDLEKVSLELKEEIREHQQSEDDLIQKSTALEAVNKELETFSYSVSHDLRAPLRRMAGFSVALLEDYGDKLDEQGRQYLKNIDASSQLATQLIDDLLKLAKVTRTNMIYEKVNLSGIAQEVVAELVKIEPGRAVTVIIAPGIFADGDRVLLHQVLENLLSNAWKYTGKTAAPRIEMGTVDHDGKLAYFVRDNGIGFDMAYADKLFKPFQRLSPAVEFTGTGIGLSTVERIVCRHGGAVWAEGKLGERATFYFTLN